MNNVQYQIEYIKTSIKALDGQINLISTPGKAIILETLKGLREEVNTLEKELKK